MVSKKKPATEKRTAFPHAADYTKAFVKDWARLSSSGRYDMKRLKEAMLLLIANDTPLDPEWLDHPVGSLAKCNTVARMCYPFVAEQRNGVAMSSSSHLSP